ncbi:MAG TPA: prephenate dehydratase domain-containing protein, partial [Verrucomicrobiales bacterium]|nr:prephenate dehydratase domain-containing protein [Verrucomicrobiales bacterium]
SIRELERLFETERERRPYICWEELLPIRHLLINRSGRFGDIRRIASHASALRQCSRFLSAVQRALPGVEITQALSTGQGVKEALGDSSVAAMASPEALEHHGSELRAVDLEEARKAGLEWSDPHTLTDFSQGFTRFWILGPRPAPMIPPPDNRIRVTQRDQLAQITGTRDHHLQKTCYLLNLPDSAGAMHRALGAFASRGISVAVLYPYPRLQRTFEYLFFAEIEGHCDDLLVAEAEREINDRHVSRPIHERPCILLGSYPNTPLLNRHPVPRAAYRRQFYPAAMVWND